MDLGDGKAARDTAQQSGEQVEESLRKAGDTINRLRRGISSSINRQATNLVRCIVAVILSALLTLAGAVFQPAPVSASLSCLPKSDFPTQLRLEPETGEEALYVADLLACTGPSGETRLYNNHKVIVWTVIEPDLNRSGSPSFLIWEGLSKVWLFRKVLDQMGYRGITVEPGQSVIVPASPERVRLSLNPRLQAAWNQIY